MTKRKRESKPLFNYLKTHVGHAYIDQDIQQQNDRIRQRRISAEQASAATKKYAVEPIDVLSTQESIEQEVEQLLFQPPPPPPPVDSDNVDDWFPPLHRDSSTPQAPLRQVEAEEEEEEGGAFYFEDGGFNSQFAHSQQQQQQREPLSFQNTQKSRISEFSDEQEDRLSVSDIETSTQEEQGYEDDRISSIDSQSDLEEERRDVFHGDMTITDTQEDMDHEYPPYEETAGEEDALYECAARDQTPINRNVINSQSFIIPTQLPNCLPSEQAEELPNITEEEEAIAAIAAEAAAEAAAAQPESEFTIDDLELPPGMAMPKLPEFRYSDKKAKENRQVIFKPGGLAARALKVIAKEVKEFVNWESRFNHELQVHDKSILKTCLESDEEVYLFRAVESWMECGLVLAWCVQLSQDEIDEMLRPPPPSSQKGNGSNSSNNTSSGSPSSSTTTSGSSSSKSKGKQKAKDDNKKDKPRGNLPLPHHNLPRYTPREDDEKILFAFSFAYNRLSYTLQREFIKRDRIIAIWPPWTSMNICVGGQDLEVNLATQFKADGI